jgi:2-polyprenyl-3-methyl-5-hydroxy-6-metoxy-1,4-benzoquinol methylase
MSVTIKDTGERLIPKGNERTLTYGEHLSRYVAALDIVKGKEVLDVASGTGYGSQMLANFAKNVQGLDYSEEAVAYAQENYPAQNLVYNIGDAQKMPFEDDSFDVVISLETIEHLPNPTAFVKEVRRVMRPNGVFLVSTPNDDEFMDGNEFHVHEFQFKELHDLMDDNFDTVEYYYQSTYFGAALLSEKSLTGGTEALSAKITFGTEKEKAIYYLAIASNGQPLPVLKENVILSDRWSTKSSIDNNNRLVQMIDEANKRANDNLEAYNTVQTRLDLVVGSRWWRLHETVSHIFRSRDG